MTTVENIEGSMLVLWVDGKTCIAPLRIDRLPLLLRLLSLMQHEDPENKHPVLCPLAPQLVDRANGLASAIQAAKFKQGA